MRWEPSCYMRPDGRTDGRQNMTKLTVAFRNFANAPKSKTVLHNIYCIPSRRSEHIDAGVALKADIMEQFLNTTKGRFYYAFCEANSCLQSRRPTGLTVLICISCISNNTLHVWPLSEYGWRPKVRVARTVNTDNKQLGSVSVTYWNIHQSANNSFHHRT